MAGYIVDPKSGSFPDEALLAIREHVHAAFPAHLEEDACVALFISAERKKRYIAERSADPNYTDWFTSSLHLSTRQLLYKSSRDPEVDWWFVNFFRWCDGKFSCRMLGPEGEVAPEAVTGGR